MTTSKTSYKIEIIGYLWEGQKTKLSDSFDTIPQNIKAEFGDLSEIIDTKITKIIHVDTFEIDGNREIKMNSAVSEVIIDWQNKESRDLVYFNE